MPANSSQAARSSENILVKATSVAFDPGIGSGRGVRGALFERGDPVDLATKVKEIVNHPASFEQLRYNARCECQD